jgi:creatinine amidohydrolase/Fe(II)-dependent formamide hydrolase-like protein
MEDNLIAQAALFIWRILGDIWEIYSSAPSFILSLDGGYESTFFLVVLWIMLVFGTIYSLFMLLELKTRKDSAKSSLRFMEIKEATLSALAESANSDEADVTLPSKATIRKGRDRTDALLERILEALENMERNSGKNKED